MSHLFTIVCVMLAALSATLGFEYMTSGYGLHPATAALLFLVCFVCDYLYHSTIHRIRIRRG